MNQPQFLPGFEPQNKQDFPRVDTENIRRETSQKIVGEVEPEDIFRGKSSAEIEASIDECKQCQLGVGSCGNPDHTKYILAKLKGR
jgi:hypothetical protein